MSWIKIRQSLLGIAVSHPQINSFGSGNALAIGSDNAFNVRLPDQKKLLYPLLFCDVTSFSNASRGVLTLTVQMYVMDRVEKVQITDPITSGNITVSWQSTEDQVISDMLLVTSDILSKLSDDPSVTFNLRPGTSGQAFVETRDDIVAGWASSLVFELPYGMDTCSVPTL
jgi:hypothetical protein